MLSQAAPADANTVDKRYQLLRMGKRQKSDYSVTWSDGDDAKEEVHSIDGVPLSSLSPSNKQDDRNHLEAPPQQATKHDFDLFDDEDGLADNSDVGKRGDKQVKLMRMGKRLVEKVRQYSRGHHGNYGSAEIGKRIALMRMG